VCLHRCIMPRATLFYGRPRRNLYILNLIAVLGAVTLVGAAAVVPFRPHVAAKIGLAGSVLLWVYYAPLIAVSIVTRFSTWHSIPFLFRFTTTFQSRVFF